MAEFTDRIRLVIDTVTSGAASDIGKVKQSVGEAEGGFGKLKAAAGGALDTLAASPVAIAGAGLAIGKMALDLATGFEDAALSAQKFATASGLAVEDASRWQEVAADAGVSTDALEGAVNKLNIAGSKGTLDALGIGGDTVNEKLIASLEHLRNVTDASERAKQGMALFGKSWTQLAPLVDEAGDLRANLAAVSDQKVIDDAEVEKAKHLRDAMDGLNDRLDDLKLALGSTLVEPLADFASALGNVGDAVSSVTELVPGMGSAMDIVTSPLRNISDGFNTLTDSSSSLTDRARGLGQAVAGAIPGPLGSWAGGLFDVSDASDDAAKAAEDSAAAAQAQAAAAKEAADALDAQTTALLASFNSQLGYQDAATKAADAADKYATAQDAANVAGGTSVEANKAAAGALNDAESAALSAAAAHAKMMTDEMAATGATLSAGEAASIQANELRTLAGTMAPGSPLAQHLLNYANQLDGLDKTVTTTINADTASAEQKVEALENQILGLVRKIFVVPVKASTSTAGVSSAAVAFESSAPTVAGLAAVGPQAVTSPAGGFVSPAAGGFGGTVNYYAITVTPTPLSTPADTARAVVDAVDYFARRNASSRRGAFN